MSAPAFGRRPAYWPHATKAEATPWDSIPPELAEQMRDARLKGCLDAIADYLERAHRCYDPETRKAVDARLAAHIRREVLR